MTNSIMSVYHKRVVYHSFVIKIQFVRLTEAQTNDAGGLMTNEDNPLQFMLQRGACVCLHKTSSLNQKHQQATVFGQKRRETLNIAASA